MTEEGKLVCELCHQEIEPEKALYVDPQWCEDCYLGTDDSKWTNRLSKDDLIDVLNLADQFRLKEFYVSYVGGKRKYMVSIKAHPSVFSVWTNRDELVAAIRNAH